MRLTPRASGYAAMTLLALAPAMAVLWLANPAWRGLFRPAEPPSRLAVSQARFDELRQQIRQLRRTGHYSQAAPLARERLELGRRLQSRGGQLDDVRREADWLEELAALPEADQAEVDDALRQLDESFQLTRNRQHEQAEVIRRRAVAALSRNFGEDDEETMHAIDDLARTLMDQRKYEEAEAHFRRLLEIRRKRFGEEGERTLESYRSVASALEGQCKFREAERLRRLDLAIVSKLDSTYLAIEATFDGGFAPDAAAVNFRYASAAGRLGIDLNRQGKYADAEPLLRKATGASPLDLWLLEALHENLVRQDRRTEASKVWSRSREVSKLRNRRKSEAGQSPHPSRP